MDSQTKLFCACALGNLEEIERIDIDPNFTVPNPISPGTEVSPLMFCAGGRQTNNIPSMEMLLAKGANVNFQTRQGHAALWWACEHGQLEKVKFLLAHNADPNLTEKHSRTPCLYWAICKANPEIARELLANGANPKQTFDYTVHLSPFEVQWLTPSMEEYAEIIAEKNPENAKCQEILSLFQL